MSERVVPAVRDRVRVEEGSAAYPDRIDRVAVVAQFSVDPVLSRSFTTLIAELHASGYFVVVSSACESKGDLVWTRGRPERTIVIRKPNRGYDFGTIAVALDRYPAIARARHVLIVNDSNVGPFRSLAPVIEHFESSDAQAWALTASNQHGFHLQSFFLGFHGGVLQEQPLMRFWRNIRHFDSKRDVILAYELGLSRLLAEEGYSMTAMHQPSDFDDASRLNLSVNLWSKLLAVGYPFVKREIVTRPWIDESGVRVPEVVRHHFGEDVAAWL